MIRVLSGWSSNANPSSRCFSSPRSVAPSAMLKAGGIISSGAPIHRNRTLPPINDSALRSAAADLIAAAKREVPAIGFALQAVERGLGTIAVEVSIGPAGITTMILFDDGGDREPVLMSLGT
jgi:hypothetical protein